MSYSFGYKSGGLNISGLPLDIVSQPALATAVIDDERNETIEMGIKSTFSDGRAVLNLAAYQTDVKDYQSNIVSSIETAAIRSYPSNIPGVRVQGAEVDFSAGVFIGLSVRASMAYAAGKNTDYVAGPCPLELQSAATVACDLTGERIAGLSRWVASLGFDYQVPVRSGEFVIHVDWNVRSGYNSDTSASRYTVPDGRRERMSFTVFTSHPCGISPSAEATRG